MSEEIKPDVIKTSDVVEEKVQQAPVEETAAPKAEEVKVEAPKAELKAKPEDPKAEKVEEAKPKAPKAKAEDPKPETPKEEVKAAPKEEPKAEPQEEPKAEPQEEPKPEEPEVNLAEQTLAGLTGLFEKLMEDVDRMKKSKEAEAIKSAFYRKLSKEKAEAGLSSEVEEPKADSPVEETEAPKGIIENPFEAVESGFKSLYNKYKKERAEYNQQLDKERAENLTKKQAVIEDLKALVEKQEDVNATFPEFRALQARWREIGPVPATNFRDLNDTYQLYVEQFYDKVQINREMRDLDFKKNLEAKEQLCKEAETLAESDDAIGAFKDLQKLHEQWKDLGPVAKEFRESIWDRFKAATATINKKYQGYFEGQKEKLAENLAAKTALCEKVEAIADKADIKSSNEWNSLSKEIEDIQKDWRKIGYASKKDNQKIYDRFRAACDKFYERKRVYYSEFKDSMNSNMEKKLDIIRQAEELKNSTEWKKATDQFIALQKQWKEIGAVPRKKSEQLWKRFRAACDEFFAERDKNAKPENDFYGNLKAKKALIEEIKAFNTDDKQLLNDAAQTFNEKWKAIGFVPFKEKEAIGQAFKDAMKEKFPDFNLSGRPARGGRESRQSSRPMTERERLVQKYNALQQEIDTYENNIGFFAQSKNAAPLIEQMQSKIDAAKKDLKALEDAIRKEDEKAEE